MAKVYLLVLLIATGCASVAPPPPVNLSHAAPAHELVIGTSTEMARAAQRICGEQSWALKPRGFDGTEAFVVCSGFN